MVTIRKYEDKDSKSSTDSDGEDPFVADQPLIANSMSCMMNPLDNASRFSNENFAPSTT